MMKDLFHNIDFLLRVFHESNSLVFVLEKDMIIYDTNIAVTNRLGFGHTAVRQKLFSDFIWNEEKDGAISVIRETINNRQNIDNDFYMVDKTGEVKLIHFKGFVYEDDLSDNHLYYILIGDDITKIKLLEQSEMVERQKFQSLFNSPGVGIVLMDLNSSIIDANLTFCDMVGYSRNELLNMVIDDLVYKKNEFTFDKIKNLLNNGSTYEQFEVQLRKKNLFNMWAFISVIFHSIRNKPLYYVATIQDITDKKYLEIRAKESEERYHLLFDRSFNAIAYKKLIYDRKGNIQDYLIIDANETFEKVTGFRKEDIIGRPMKAKAQEHFKVTAKENFGRLKRYDQILKDGKDVHFKSQPSRTFKRPIDVYYYIVDKKEDMMAVVFGDVHDPKVAMTL